MCMWHDCFMEGKKKTPKHNKMPMEKKSKL